MLKHARLPSFNRWADARGRKAGNYFPSCFEGYPDMPDGGLVVARSGNPA